MDEWVPVDRCVEGCPGLEPIIHSTVSTHILMVPNDKLIQGFSGISLKTKHEGKTSKFDFLLLLTLPSSWPHLWLPEAITSGLGLVNNMNIYSQILTNDNDMSTCRRLTSYRKALPRSLSSHFHHGHSFGKGQEDTPKIYIRNHSCPQTNLNVDALTLRWPCPKQTKTTAVLAGVRVREGCETGSKQVRRW